MKVVIIFVSFIAYLLSPVAALAQVPEPWEDISPLCAIGDVATIQGFECIFTNITRILVPLAGLLLFVMLVVGSFQLITAGGEAKALQKARGTFTFAIVGLVAFLGIWLILLLIKAITGVDVTKFVIPNEPSPIP